MTAVSLFQLHLESIDSRTGWRELASTIPDPELQKQVIASIDSKAFHCEGGPFMGSLPVTV
jgi:hypothetical protein